MIKRDLIHNHLKVRSACKRLGVAIERNPDFFRGLKMPANEIVRPVKTPWRNLSTLGILFAFILKLINFTH